jgi:3-oxoadipate CoA-transferase, alpha subunit
VSGDDSPPRPLGDKVVGLADALAGVEDGMTVMIGGWGECGTPTRLIAALAAAGRRDLGVIITGSAPTEPLHRAGCVTRMVTSFGSYPGRAGQEMAFEEAARAGRLAVELCSQGMLAERIRAGGAGIPAFYVEERMVGPFRSTGESRVLGGRRCVLETALRADVALVGATIADRAGNLTWSHGERNFNEPMAYAADLVIVEAFELYEVGWLPPEHVMVPALAVDRIVAPEI